MNEDCLLQGSLSPFQGFHLLRHFKHRPPACVSVLRPFRAFICCVYQTQAFSLCEYISPFQGFYLLRHFKHRPSALCECIAPFQGYYRLRYFNRSLQACAGPLPLQGYHKIDPLLCYPRLCIVNKFWLYFCFNNRMACYLKG